MKHTAKNREQREKNAVMWGKSTVNLWNVNLCYTRSSEK